MVFKEEERVFFKLRDDPAIEFGTVGTFLGAVIGPEGEETSEAKVRFDEFKWIKEVVVNQDSLAKLEAFVEMSSSAMQVTSSMIMHVTHGCRKEEDSETFTVSYKGNAVPPRAVPKHDVEIRFSVDGMVYSTPIMAVDRGQPARPWVRILEEGTARFPFKEEQLYFAEMPGEMRFELAGMGWSPHVSKIFVDGQEVDENISRYTEEDQDSSAISNKEDAPIRWVIFNRTEENIPHGSLGSAVYDVTGPSGEPDYVRVRFHDSTWDLKQTSVTDVELPADTNCVFVQNQGLHFSVVSDYQPKKRESESCCVVS
mmetsp:Transcript_34154/g.74365  ORF Transcript_34154/g.74365 Transcript_34154/m.74365 type:complete len:312 (-) Transcript_34154:43-978(-)